MRTIHEQLDDELYLDFALEPKEITHLQEHPLEPIQILLNGQVVNIWIRPATIREMYDQWEEEN
jgi:hypothetical protein